MNGELRRIAARRAQLVAQAAAQREWIALQLAPWRPRLTLADRVIAAVRYARRYPAVLAAAGLLVAGLKLHRAAGWVQRGWLLWRVGRGLRS